MKRMALAVALFVCACGQQTRQADSPAQAPTEAQTAAFEHEALVGTWSFDRSCASGDGMRLNADDTASFDEWGEGNWSVDAENRLVLDVAVHEPGVGPTGERQTLVLAINGAITDDLNAELAGTPPRAINARRCPE